MSLWGAIENGHAECIELIDSLFSADMLEKSNKLYIRNAATLNLECVKVLIAKGYYFNANEWTSGPGCKYICFFTQAIKYNASL